MSLVAKPEITEKKLGANQVNGELSSGAKTPEPSALALKMEDASFRQIWRFTSLLMKIKERDHRARISENPPSCHDVYENKGC